MTYFSRRNNYKVEYSGFEDVSEDLRARILEILGKFVQNYASSYGDHKPYFIRPRDFTYVVQQELPQHDPFITVQSGTFDEVFTVVEIFLDEVEDRVDRRRAEEAILEICKAFHLSGSVYEVNPREKRVELVPNEELAKQIKEAETVLQPYADAYKKFFEAVGNLFGRKAKAGDVVRDVYVSAEAYLKAITGEAQYSSAVKKLEKSGAINREQKVVLEQLYAFRSNTQGTTHAGSAPEVDEKQALWFVDTMSAQFRHLDVQAKEGKL